MIPQEHPKVFLRRIPVQEQFERAIEALEQGDFARGEPMLHELLNLMPDNVAIQYNLAYCARLKGCFGLSTALLQQVTKTEPTWHYAWNMLGGNLQDTSYHEPARIAFKEAIKTAVAQRDALRVQISANYEEAKRRAAEIAMLTTTASDYHSNLAGTYVNQAAPRQVIEWSEKALDLNADNLQAKWHKAIGLLEDQQWAVAWDYHDSRLSKPSGCDFTPRNYHRVGVTPQWDGKSKGLVVVHGEQGVGDEIMFASCLPEAIASGARIVVEPNPRLEAIFRRSFPGCEVHGTHKTDGSDWRTGSSTVPGLNIATITTDELQPAVDYQIALGSLPKFYRRSAAAFPGTPYLKADPAKVAAYRARLPGRRMRVGISWQGGVGKTRIDLRSIPLEQMIPILSLDCDFVSLNYPPHTGAEVAAFIAQGGPPLTHWPEVEAGKDCDELAAVIAGLDLVVTVCQTAYHVAGALGVPCWMLTPAKPDWRVASKDNRLPWYGSVKLYRENPSKGWAPVIESIEFDLRQKLIKRAA